MMLADTDLPPLAGLPSEPVLILEAPATASNFIPSTESILDFAPRATTLFPAVVLLFFLSMSFPSVTLNTLSIVL